MDSDQFFDGCKTPSCVASRVSNRIYYAKSKNGNYWQSPEETLKNKRGSCGAQALLVREGLEKIGVKDSEIISAKKNKDMGHCAVFFEYKGKEYIIDSTKGIPMKEVKVYGNYDDLAKEVYPGANHWSVK
jgi:predicted transglutaminase-like cysteine proteinase